jgi:hypothetical protein
MNQKEKYNNIVELIKQYNEEAIKENSNMRLGLASSSSYRDGSDDDDEDEENNSSKPFNYEEFIKNNYYYENAGISIDTFGTDGGWFPSSVC